MPYTPNASNLSEPSESRDVVSAAREFRTLKEALLSAVQGLDTDNATQDANITLLTARIAALESAYLASGGVSPSAVYRFTTDGTSASYTLTGYEGSVERAFVFLNGVYQNQLNYTIVGSTLTFDETPPANLAVEVHTYVAIFTGATDSVNVAHVTRSGELVDAYSRFILEEDITSRRSLADVFKKGIDTGSITIALYGTSITYCQDTSVTGTNSAINGASQKRSSSLLETKLTEALSFSGIPVSVVNRGFPGDRTTEGLTRWASASATDVALIEYGHNDAMNYGGYPSGTVSMADYRKNLSTIIQREIGKGAAVVVVGSTPVADPAANLKIRSYAVAAREIATIFNVPFVDWAEIIETVDSKWTDNVHLATHANSEIAWALAGLFYRKDAAIHKVAPGDWFNANDALGFGGSRYAWAPAKQGAAIIQLNAGQSYAVGVTVEADCLPIIHTVNTSGSAFTLNCYYAGSVPGGIPTTGLIHDQSKGIRQKFAGPLLKSGLRTFVIRNDGATTAYIEAIEFRGSESVSVSRGIVTKSSLSGVHQSALIAGAFADWWAAADYTRKLTADCSLAAYVTLTETHICGIAIGQYRQQAAAPEVLSGNLVWAYRSGTSLVIRQLVGGAVSGTDSSFAGAFSAGVFTGELGITLVTSGATTTLSAYVDGSLIGSRVVTQTYGYPMLLANKNARMVCHSMQFNGEVKAGY